MSNYSISEKECVGFYCEKIDNENRWTLTSILGDLLYQLENRYGRRDTQWTIIGVEIHDVDFPHIWYPGCRDHVAIALSNHVSNDYKLAIFQLAHEVVHLLSPTGGSNAPVIEEGLATIFAEEISLKNNLGFIPGNEFYDAAASLTREYIGDNHEAIKNLREVNPKFSEMSPELLCKIMPKTKKELAETLCTPFSDFVKTAKNGDH